MLPVFRNAAAGAAGGGWTDRRCWLCGNAVLCLLLALICGEGCSSCPPRHPSLPFEGGTQALLLLRDTFRNIFRCCANALRDLPNLERLFFGSPLHSPFQSSEAKM